MSNTNETLNTTTSRASEAIVDLVYNIVGNAAFDTTIRAIVQEKVDNATGKFKLQYQDSVFYAFADDIKTNYTKGTEVFVLVPQNDFTQDKRIIGSVKTLGEDYIGVFADDERYKKIGASAFGENSEWFKIKSKTNQEQNTILYGTGANVTKPLTLDRNFLSYLKKEKVNGLWLEGTFKTYLNQVQDFNGANYGLKLTFFVKEGENEPTPHTVQLDVNSMEGTPFNLSGNRQVIVFSGIDWSTVDSIDSLEFFADGFTIDSVEEDLFVKDIKMYAVSYISDEEIVKSGLILSSPQGLYIDGAPINLTATLRIDGKVQRDKVIYYWFIKDPTIKADSNKSDLSPVYNAAGGPGWRCLNSATVKEETVTTETKNESGEVITKTEIIPIINWADGTDTWAFDSESIPSAQATIMCVAKFENTLYTDTITIYDTNQTKYFVLTASKEFFTKSDQEITLTLQEQEIEDEEDNITWNTYKWYKQDLYGGAPAEITQDVSGNTTLVIKGTDIVNEATYMVAIQGTETKNGETTNHSFTTNPVTLSMRLDEQEEVPPQYTLTIINGDQVFQYNEEGYAPNSPAWVTHSPQDIKELSFVLFDNQLGRQVDADSQQWTIPTEKTLLDGEGGIETKQTFNIASMYNASYSNNQITLEVTYNGMIFTATTNFVFVKQGDPGTNGTDVVIVITKNANNNLIVKKYVGSEETIVDDITPQQVTYEKNGETIETGVYKATVTEDNKVYYGYYIPPITINDTTTYHLVGSPSQYVVYDADGTNPKYADFQFEKKDGNENWGPIAVKFTYGTGNKGSLYSVIPKTFNSTLAESEGVFQITAYDDDTPIATITLLASLNRYAFSMVNDWDGNLNIDKNNNCILAQSVIAGTKNGENSFTGIIIGEIGKTNSVPSKTGLFGFNKGVQTVFISAEDGSARFGASSTAGFEWYLDPNPKDRDDSYLSFSVINNDSSKNLLKVSKDEYYLQSANFENTTSGISGMKINLKDGSILSKNFQIESNGNATFSGTVYAEGGTFYNNVIIGSGTSAKSVSQVLESLQTAVDDAQKAIQGLDSKISSIELTSAGKLTYKITEDDTGTDGGSIDGKMINFTNGKICDYNGNTGVSVTTGIGMKVEDGGVIATSTEGAKIAYNNNSFYVNNDSCRAVVNGTQLTLTQIDI